MPGAQCGSFQQFRCHLCCKLASEVAVTCTAASSGAEVGNHPVPQTSIGSLGPWDIFWLTVRSTSVWGPLASEALR